MVVRLGQQYNVGEKPTVILYTYINAMQGQQTKTKTNKLLRRFLEQDLVGVAVSAVESVDVSGVGGSFRLLRRNYGTSSVPTLHLWAVPVLAAKLSKQGEMYGLPLLQLENYPIFVACIRVAITCQR